MSLIDEKDVPSDADLPKAGKSRGTPVSFQHALLAALKRSVNVNRLAHAYLVVGAPRGNARVFAEQILALLYCESEGDRPCGDCRGCRCAVEHSHPDLIWMEPKKKSRGILLDQVHAVRDHVFRTSFEGGWKSVVLVSADRLNEEASNTLLKTLEEPPAKTLFLLLTDVPEALLPTVVSRCQRVVLSKLHLSSDLSSEALAKEDSGFRSAVVDVVTGVRGNGVVVGIARAHMILNFLKDIRKQIEAFERENAGIEDQGGELREDMKTIVDARVEARYREARNLLLCSLLFWYRDILLCVCGVDESAFYFRGESLRIKAMAAGLTHRQALANIRQIEDMKSQLEQHLAEAMVIERGMMRLTGMGREG